MTTSLLKKTDAPQPAHRCENLHRAVTVASGHAHLAEPMGRTPFRVRWFGLP